jgi:hypothetical protein
LRTFRTLVIHSSRIDITPLESEPDDLPTTVLEFLALLEIGNVSHHWLVNGNNTFLPNQICEFVFVAGADYPGVFGLVMAPPPDTFIRE